MQQKIQNFVYLCEQILSESGDLRNRKSWPALNSTAKELAPYMRQLTQSFAPKYSLLFLLACENEGNQKSGCFSMLFRRILVNIPSLDLYNVISQINRLDLNVYLLPFLYEQGNYGSVAVYLAACLGLKIKQDSFEFFLSSRDWSQEDLVNLSFLVLIDEKDELILNLDEIYKTNGKESIGSFLNVLNSSNITEPVKPNVKPVEENTTKSSTIKRQSIVSSKNDQQKLSNNQVSKLNTNDVSDRNADKKSALSESSLLNNEITAIGSNNKIVKETLNTSTMNNEVSEKKDNSSENDNVDKSDNNKTINRTKTKNNEFLNKVSEVIESIKVSISNISSVNVKASESKGINNKFIFIISIVAVLFLAIFVFFSGSNNSDSNIKVPSKEGKIPEYWVDAISNKHITPTYIKADVDYRMAELYLARGLYNEAATFFQSAVNIEPKHYIAKMRWGYSELVQGNTLVAKQHLNEAYKGDPKLQNLNLYLARLYAKDNNSKNALKHYKDELKLYNELDVGVELANYLASIGKNNDAMDLISKLQEKFPGKMIVLDANSVNK